MAAKRKATHLAPGRTVSTRYGNRDTTGVVTGVRAGRVAVDLDIPGTDEAVHALLREDDVTPV